VARFEVLDPHGGPPPPGPWATSPAPAASFGAGEAAAPLWRVVLSADGAAAHAELSAAELGLAAQERALAAAPGRLRVLAAAGGAASFGAPADTPEARLLLLLDAPDAGAASFGAGAETDELSAAEERFRAFVGQVQDAVANFAVVETRQEGALLARSAVSWTGDLRSLLAAGLAGEQPALHRRSLALALRSRAALLHTFATVMRGAAIVAVMASSPLAAARALPAAWRFVDDLLWEARGEPVAADRVEGAGL
jgi:hypothetical protein